jgi:hypothetical protein
MSIIFEANFDFSELQQALELGFWFIVTSNLTFFLCYIKLLNLWCVTSVPSQDENEKYQKAFPDWPEMTSFTFKPPLADSMDEELDYLQMTEPISSSFGETNLNDMSEPLVSPLQGWKKTQNASEHVTELFGMPE